MKIIFEGNSSVTRTIYFPSCPAQGWAWDVPRVPGDLSPRDTSPRECQSRDVPANRVPVPSVPEPSVPVPVPGTARNSCPSPNPSPTSPKGLFHKKMN